MCVCFSLLARGQTEVAPQQLYSNQRQKRRPGFVKTNATVPSNDIYEFEIAVQSRTRSDPSDNMASSTVEVCGADGRG